MKLSCTLGTCALTLFAGGAQAQSSITIYGRLDASTLHISGSKPKTALDEGSGATSHIGFRGTEDLGGGLSALFNLESKVGVDTGSAGAAANSGAYRNSATAMFSRGAYVGLRGSAGTLTLGRNYTSAIRALYNVSVIPVGINTGLGTNVAPQGIGNDFWNSNEIKYDSPEWKGLSFMTNYAPGEVAASSSRGKSYGAAAFYRNAGFVLTAGHQKDADIATDNSLNWSVLTAAYSTGPLKVTAGYDRVSNPSQIAGWTDSRLWTFGGAYTVVPALTVAAQFYRSKDTATGTGSKQLVLNAQYALSKRSSLYATVTRTNNGAIAIMPIYNTAGTPYDRATGIALGMQHSF